MPRVELQLIRHHTQTGRMEVLGFHEVKDTVTLPGGRKFHLTRSGSNISITPFSEESLKAERVMEFPEFPVRVPRFTRNVLARCKELEWHIANEF